MSVEDEAKELLLKLERDDRLTTDEIEELAQLRQEVSEGTAPANEVLRTASASFAAQFDPTRPR